MHSLTCPCVLLLRLYLYFEPILSHQRKSSLRRGRVWLIERVFLPATVYLGPSSLRISSNMIYLMLRSITRLDIDKSCSLSPGKVCRATSSVADEHNNGLKVVIVSRIMNGDVGEMIERRVSLFRTSRGAMVSM